MHSGFPAPGTRIDEDSNIRLAFSKELPKRMDELVDGFLDLGFETKEKIPADIAFDVDYRVELRRRESLPGFRGMGNKLKEVDKQILRDSDNPTWSNPRPWTLAHWCRVALDINVETALQNL